MHGRTNIVLEGVSVISFVDNRSTIDIPPNYAGVQAMNLNLRGNLIRHIDEIERTVKSGWCAVH
jgi:hypothetical protein